MDTVDKVLLQEDLDPEEESPFRRRRKGVTVRRSRLAPFTRLLRWVSWAVLVSVPLAFAGYRLGPFLANSSLFRLDPAKDVQIDGNHFVPREEIVNALGIPPVESPRDIEANIFQFSLDEKRRRVESIPWIRSAVLNRVYPHRLVVQVVERAPVAFANIGGRIELVDSEGTLLEKPEKAFFDFPIIAGLIPRAGRASVSRAWLYTTPLPSSWPVNCHAPDGSFRKWTLRTPTTSRRCWSRARKQSWYTSALRLSRNAFTTCSRRSRSYARRMLRLTLWICATVIKLWSTRQGISNRRRGTRHFSRTLTSLGGV
jgi:cell division septal protein FtsQ